MWRDNWLNRTAVSYTDGGAGGRPRLPWPDHPEEHPQRHLLPPARPSGTRADRHDPCCLFLAAARCGEGGRRRTAASS
jgi:hypothetical protein